MGKHPYFEKIRDRSRERMLSSIREDAGESFQRIISKAEDDLHKPGARELFDAISKLSTSPDGPDAATSNLVIAADGATLELGKKEAVILRSALEAVWAGCDARIRAGIAHDAVRDKPAARRAQAWAAEYGMAAANRAVTTGGRTAMNHLLAYVQHIYENADAGIDPSNASREERIGSVEYVRRSFKLQSEDSTIKALQAARDNSFVIEVWPDELLPLRKIVIPGR